MKLFGFCLICFILACDRYSLFQKYRLIPIGNREQVVKQQSSTFFQAILEAFTIVIPKSLSIQNINLVWLWILQRKPIGYSGVIVVRIC